MIKHRRISKLAILLGSILTCALCAGAALPDSGANEKLLTAIRDADSHTASSLLSSGADANAKDNDGLTALMYAAMYAGADCVELLRRKALTRTPKANRMSPHLMLASGQADKVRLLLSKGAQVNAKSKEGHTALTIAATRGGSAEIVRMLLDNGADLTAGNVLPRRRDAET
jgi:ankyrin repeat protein